MSWSCPDPKRMFWGNCESRNNILSTSWLYYEMPKILWHRLKLQKIYWAPRRLITTRSDLIKCCDQFMTLKMLNDKSTDLLMAMFLRLVCISEPETILRRASTRFKLIAYSMPRTASKLQICFFTAWCSDSSEWLISSSAHFRTLKIHVLFLLDNV